MKKFRFLKFDNWRISALRPGVARLVFNFFLRSFLAFISVTAISCVVMFFYFASYIAGVFMDPSQNSLPHDLGAMKLRLTSFIYAADENGEFKEHAAIHGEENRIWVDFDKIPSAMKDAMIAIEDKRFEKHNGIDWRRTLGAVKSLLTGKRNTYGGSTITQQTVKNLSEENAVSLKRKIREIARSSNLETRYSKDQILEAYLNLVNFGGGSRGVQAAAKMYFDKDIKDCSIAQCAAIAGITQNPSQYMPLIYPENNKKRREVVLTAMLEQGKITKEEYSEAREESNNMEFKKGKNFSDSEEKKDFIYDWYMEGLISDVKRDLSEHLKISLHSAEDMLYNQGLKIYSAVNLSAQNFIQESAKKNGSASGDPGLEIGISVLDPTNGRILASVGSRKEKLGNLMFDRANFARRQPGSAMKPLSVYAPAMDRGLCHWSSLISNQKIPNYFGPGKPGPHNWTVADDVMPKVLMIDAVEHSINVPAVRLVEILTPSKSVEFLSKYLGFYELGESDKSLPLGVGGLDSGVTVREMASAYQIFGNRGVYHAPFTYFYVLDREGKSLLDNRQKPPIQAINPSTANVMNRVLRNAVVGERALARKADVKGYETIGKTGTTDGDKDYWFVGLVPPYFSIAIWMGYDDPKRTLREDREGIKDLFRNIATALLKDKPSIPFELDKDVAQIPFCKTSGKLAVSTSCNTSKGYYAKNNMPDFCDVHGRGAPKVWPPHLQEAPEETPEENSHSDIFH
ncbi:MAG: transglycosylase domain-containing protein [Oscillospiraceae bacterium]|nr:transglycosylase domain-containing protein [Oscillospiraceae bacterium]